ncbi:MAG: glycoprotease [Campylobacter sp.]|nr:glycoprotease [Campylobacter sp.]
MVGIYEDGILVDEILSTKKSSEALIDIFDEILSKYEIERIIYTNGPGSFMGIKVSYIILKTISKAKEIKFSAVSGFELNSNSPIKANKNLSFVMEDGEILLKKVLPGEFKLSKSLFNLNIQKDTLPNYVLGAV